MTQTHAGAVTHAMEQPRHASAQNQLLCVVLVVLVSVPLTHNNYILAAHVVSLVVLLPALIPVAWRSGYLRVLWVAAILWAAVQVVSSVVLGGELVAATGFVGMLTLAIVTLLVWLRDVCRISAPTVLLALTTGWLGLAFVGMRIHESPNPWKYGLATPVLALLLALTWRYQAPRWVVLGILGAFAILSLATDARFFVLLALLTGVVAISRSRARERRSKRVLVVSGIAAVMMYFLYPHVALSGALGERTQVQQTRYEATGANFAIDNRAEMFQAAYILAQHPALGIGAKGQLSTSEASAAISWLERIGVDISPARIAYLTDSYGTNQGWAPHSLMLDSAIQAGVLALPFWLIALGGIGRRLSWTAENDGEAALVTFMAGATTWNALFSPLDPTTYLTLAVAIYLAVRPGRSGKHAPEHSPSPALAAGRPFALGGTEGIDDAARS